MLDIEDVWSALDHAHEEIAQQQYEIACREPISGDPDIFNKPQLLSVELSMYVGILEEYDLGVSAEDNEVIETLTYNIKRLTKDLRQWD